MRARRHIALLAVALCVSAAPLSAQPTFVHATAGRDSNGCASNGSDDCVTSAAVSYVADDVLIIALAANGAGYHAAGSVTLTAANVSWQTPTGTPAASLADTYRLIVRCGVASGTGTNEAITIRPSSALDDVSWVVAVVSGADTTAPCINANGSGGTGTTASTTLSGLSSGNAVYATATGFGGAAGSTFTAEMGFTELGETTSTFGGSHSHQYRGDVSDTTPTATQAGNEAWAIVAVEVVAAGEDPEPPSGRKRILGGGFL